MRRAVFVDYALIGNQLHNAAFPRAPGLCSRQTDRFIFTAKSFVICADQIAALLFRNGRKIVFPAVRKNRACSALVEPSIFFLPSEINTAENQRGDTFTMRFSVTDTPRTP